MDADLIAELDNALKPNLKCVERIVAQHGEEVREMLLAAIAHPAPANKVSQVLRKRGIVASNKLIQSHRTGACGCE